MVRGDPGISARRASSFVAVGACRVAAVAGDQLGRAELEELFRRHRREEAAAV
jgi:hypothetical protein